MPAKSKQQQKFFGVVKAMQSGDIPKKGAAGAAAKDMSKKEVDKYASTKHKGLPMKVNENFASKLNNIMKRSRDAKQFIKNTLANSHFKSYNDPDLRDKFVAFLMGLFNDPELGKLALYGESIYTNENLGIEIIESSKPFPIQEAEYQGRKVKLGQVTRTSGDKKFQVYVKNPKTDNIKKLKFGDGTGLSIKTKDPKRRKSFKARHNCDNPGPKDKARYWSCRMWAGPDSVKNMLKKKK